MDLQGKHDGTCRRARVPPQPTLRTIPFPTTVFGPHTLSAVSRRTLRAVLRHGQVHQPACDDRSEDLRLLLVSASQLPMRSVGPEETLKRTLALRTDGLPGDRRPGVGATRMEAKRPRIASSRQGALLAADVS